MNKWNKFISEKEMPINFVRFYAVGLLLFLLPWTRSIFVTITPYTLLLVFAVVFYFHKKWDFKTIMVFSFIAVASYFLEVAGVSTDKIFGSYVYGSGLGLKIAETPLIIGLNWLFLVYSSHSIVSIRLKNPFLKIITGAALMVLYDIIIEFVAPEMKMWKFSGYYPPVQNFISWFAAAVVFHTIVTFSGIKTNNKPARSLFIIQLSFFVILTIFITVFLK